MMVERPTRLMMSRSEDYGGRQRISTLLISASLELETLYQIWH